MTRAELVRKSEELQKQANRNFLPLLAYVVILALFLWWANFHKEIISERISAMIFFAGFFGIYVVLIFIAMFTTKQRLQLGCHSPQCNKRLIGGTLKLAIASGRCGYCGSIILEDWNK
jgi:uncharacterized membrane protein